jgi:hypothetical protein
MNDKDFAPSLLNELFDDFKVIAVFHDGQFSTNQDENYYSFPYRLCKFL